MNPVQVDICHGDLIANLVKCHKPKSVLELGFGSGFSARKILAALDYNESEALAASYGSPATYTMVDNWLDWAAVARNNGLIGNDGIHLTADGRSVLATAVARSLEFAHDRNNGQCLEPVFHDDSKVLAAMPTTIPAETVTTDVP